MDTFRFILGLLKLYERKPVDIYKEFLHALVSTPAIVVYIALTAFLLYSPMTRNNFVGDDFTWFRWASDCSVKTASGACRIDAETIGRYFTQSNGFSTARSEGVFSCHVFSFLAESIRISHGFSWPTWIGSRARVFPRKEAVKTLVSCSVCRNIIFTSERKCRSGVLGERDRNSL